MKLDTTVTHKHSINSYNKLAYKFTEAHGDTYDYSKVVFINGDTKVNIICKKHGVFSQKPTAHIRGQGCPACAKQIISAKLSLQKQKPFKEFVEEACATHSNKYAYTMDSYNGVKNKVTIHCPIHGEFKQLAYSHLQGHGCVKCRRLYNTNTFIKKASIVHKGKYTYTNTEYTSWDSLVTVTCKEHGDFTQEAHTHLRGCGCPSCATRGFKKDLPGLFYYIKFNKSTGTYYKLGITNNTIDTRYSSAELANAEILWTAKFPSGGACFAFEQDLLKEFISLKYTGAPILLNGNTELITEDKILRIKEKYAEITDTI